MRSVVLALLVAVTTAHAEPDLRPWKIVPHLAERAPKLPKLEQVPAHDDDGVTPLVREYEGKLVVVAVRTLGTVARLATDGVKGWKVSFAGTLGIATAF
jgi:hypothetical protein